MSSSYPTPDGIQQSDGCYYALKSIDVVSPTRGYEFLRWRTSCDFTASDGNKYLVNDKTQVWHSYSIAYQYALKQSGTWSILTNKGWMTLDAYNSVVPPAGPQPQPAGGNNPQPNLLQDANDRGKIQAPIDSGMRVWTRPKDCLMNDYDAECTAIRAQKDQAERERLSVSDCSATWHSSTRPSATRLGATKLGATPRCSATIRRMRRGAGDAGAITPAGLGEASKFSRGPSGPPQRR